MSEPVTEADLQAYADGNLPEERRSAVAAWLAAHPDDAERIETYRRIAEELRTSYDGVLHEPVPERLQRAVQRPRTRAFALVAGAVLLGVALGGLGGWQLRGIQGTPSTPGTARARSRGAQRSRTRLTRRKCAILSKSAQTRRRISSRGFPSASARSCARRS